MKQEKGQAILSKLWIALQEGKIFTPAFVVVTFLLFHILVWDFQFGSFLLALFWAFPVFILYYFYDFPLHLRFFLWLPIIVYEGLFGGFHLQLFLLAAFLYFIWVVLIIGTWHYHRAVGIEMDNYRRYWKLPFVHSGATSENAGEQLPKIILLLMLLQTGYSHSFFDLDHLGYLVFVVIWSFSSFLIHRYLFDWKPVEDDRYVLPVNQTRAKRIIMIVIEGCSKKQLEDAYTPFLEMLASKGTVYQKMETVYPARTYSTATTLYTGAYPSDHGVKNDLLTYPLQEENLFEQLKKRGRKGIVIGPSYLQELFGSEFTQVVEGNPSESTTQIIEQAKNMVKQQSHDFIALHFHSVEQIGKAKGPDSIAYQKQIQDIDVRLSVFYRWLKENGYLEETLLIVTSNHGLSDGGGHGHLNYGERYVPLILHGSMFGKGKAVLTPHQITSIASTVTHLLGVEKPAQAKGAVLVEEMK